MTIEEAKTKLCPFIQVRGAGFSFEGKKDTNHTLCCTSDCMAWKFKDIPISEPDKFGRYRTKPSKTEGYCSILK